MPDRDLFDCNGDGQFSVADYAEHPELLPEATDTHPRGDANRNGRFDVQDLFKQFSDGIDDDGNGYVDDIAGWDFNGDDNDPSDPLERAENTLQALIAGAEANNDSGRAGVCPRCQLLPLRVGDELVSEPQRVGEAIAYAADRGALVVHFSVGALGVSQFLSAAVDYAAQRGAMVIVGSGNRDSRRQQPLTTLNRSITVGGISLLGDDQQSTTARSYVAYDTCGNFGAQLLLPPAIP
jgi:subtilisin family serine protease